MTRIALLASCVLIGVLIGACTVIKINEGDTTTIQHKPGDEKDLTARACRKAGQQSAEIISTINKDPALPPGTGTQVTTFRCSAAAPRP